MTTTNTNNEQGASSADQQFISEAIQYEFLRLRRTLKGFNDRLERMEANGENRKNGHQRGRRVADLEENEEEEKEHDRRPRRGNRNGRRKGEEEDDDLGAIKISIPIFAGKRDPNVYLEWESKVEKVFSFHNYSERKKHKKVVLEFKEFANAWWDRKVLDRRRNGDDHIETWRELKIQMRKQWDPARYHRDLHLQLQELVQGRILVAEYDYLKRLLLKKLGIVEDPQTTISRFIKGLNWHIKDEIDMGDYLDYEDMIKKAIQVEKKLQKRKKRNQNWRNSKDTRSDFKPRVEASKAMEKSKVIEKGKAKFGEPQKQNSSMRCFKCQGRGHIAKDYPNKRGMILTQTGDIETDPEDYKDAESGNEEVEEEMEI